MTPCLISHHYPDQTNALTNVLKSTASNRLAVLLHRPTKPTLVLRRDAKSVTITDIKLVNITLGVTVDYNFSIASSPAIDRTVQGNGSGCSIVTIAS